MRNIVRKSTIMVAVFVLSMAPARAQETPQQEQDINLGTELVTSNTTGNVENVAANLVAAVQAYGGGGKVVSITVTTSPTGATGTLTLGDGTEMVIDWDFSVDKDNGLRPGADNGLLLLAEHVQLQHRVHKSRHTVRGGVGLPDDRNRQRS